MGNVRSYTLAPLYENDFCQCIGVLQNLQTLLDNDATLADVEQVIRDFQKEFGFQEPLEHVIQVLVGRFLEKQMVAGKSAYKGAAR